MEILQGHDMLGLPQSSVHSKGGLSSQVILVSRAGEHRLRNGTSAVLWAESKIPRTPWTGPECTAAASTCCMYCWHASDTIAVPGELKYRMSNQENRTLNGACGLREAPILKAACIMSATTLSARLLSGVCTRYSALSHIKRLQDDE